MAETPPPADQVPTARPGFPLAGHDQAMAVRRAVLGDDHVDRSIAATTDLTTAFQDLATTMAWGGLWSRDGLDRPDRSLVTIGILAALGRTDELRMHLQAALARTGADRGAIVEVLLHVGVYAGLPAANEGFRLLAELAAHDPPQTNDQPNDQADGQAGDGGTATTEDGSGTGEEAR